MLALTVTPQGHLLVQPGIDGDAPDPSAKRITAAFGTGLACGLLHLGTVELQTSLSPPLTFARDFARSYLTRLCQTPDLDGATEVAPLPPPPAAELAATALQAPPMVGLEYLSADVLSAWWTALDALVRDEISAQPGGAQAYLREKNPLWRLVGRVTFHLAENKRDPQYPFAFLATYASRLSAQGKVQHEPLGRALEQYSGAKNRPLLLSLLTPLDRAAQQSVLAKELIDTGDVFQPLAWTPQEAYRFLQDIPIFEASGLIVRVPNWWRDNRPPRPQVRVTVGGRRGAHIGADELLAFSVQMALDGEPLSEQELADLLAGDEGLVLLKGKWVEVDREKLSQALQQWQRVDQEAGEEGGLSFFEGMRLLAGAPLGQQAAAATAPEIRDWVGVSASDALAQTLDELRDPAGLADPQPPGLQAELRPYQAAGVHWLRLITRLGLGACLADDMGLGKTIQVIALLLHRKQECVRQKTPTTETPPSLLVVPASLIANWKDELARFSPSLAFFVAHPSELPLGDPLHAPAALDNQTVDLVITTYGMLTRLDWARERHWSLVILDEAQAIKNPSTRQTRAALGLRAAARVALMGTPVENRLGDLWSIFNFLNPGLLGGAKEFTQFVKRLEGRERADYGPLRSLIQPYILRRLKTDKRVIADLPDKTEATAYCGLSKQQAALYQKLVQELARRLKEVEGVQRRGLVLAQLMRLKQICNHPSQASGTGGYDPRHSGKFQRLAEICDELRDRQERVLVFTQFREITEPLAEFLGGVFGRPGLVLHGGTSVARRRELVQSFQREDGPPFFILSLKAGGTGLNLTAASHVIHFDRWWNPAVENQATDRAFRIGQRQKVFVHKFVCRGTVEEKIDALIASKTGLARDLLEAGGEVRLTEMDNEQLLGIIALDIHKALDA